jgi:hypothetical protein
MATKREGPLARLAKRLGLGTTGGGNQIPYEGCLACFLGRHGVDYSPTCTCCRNGHARMK